jgi:uncharacterized protein YabE (DUF348 family)/3D (Asp-Asp-Asp) domain-containing protein
MRHAKRRATKRNHFFLRLSAILLPVILVVVGLSQTAFAKTYVITDGDRVVTYTTFATDPTEILGQAGMDLQEDDTYVTTGATGITIRRAQTVYICYHGEWMEVSTPGETAGELLARMNLDVDGEDVLSHSLETPTFEGMELRVDRVVCQQETYTSTLEHETTYCTDATIPEGHREVLIQGRDGELRCTANVTYINGVETEREVLSQDVTIAPVTEIVAQGTGTAAETAVDPEAMPIIGDGYITLPTGEVLTYTDTATVRATAYTHTDAGCDLITATGSTVHVGTVAVDPRYIPYGTRMFIVANDGSYIYGISEAEDCGGAIKGDRVDLYFPTYAECMAFGWRTCTIYFLG